LPSLLLVDQDSLLPFAGFLVSAMNATRPAARAFLALQKLLDSSPDAPCASLLLPGIFNPANELVSADRRQIFPKSGQFPGFSQGIVQIIRHVVDESTREAMFHRFNLSYLPGEVTICGQLGQHHI
jgi:hypothetical protein